MILARAECNLIKAKDCPEARTFGKSNPLARSDYVSDGLIRMNALLFLSFHTRNGYFYANHWISEKAVSILIVFALIKVFSLCDFILIMG